MSPKMAPAPRDEESEVLKDSKWAFSVGNSLGGSRFWESLERKDNGLSKWMWSKRKAMSVGKWSEGQFLRKGYRFNYLIRPNTDHLPLSFCSMETFCLLCS